MFTASGAFGSVSGVACAAICAAICTLVRFLPVLYRLPIEAFARFLPMAAVGRLWGSGSARSQQLATGASRGLDHNTPRAELRVMGHKPLITTPN